MQYSGEGVQALVGAFEDLKSAKLIYAVDNLRRILKCLAYYDELRTALEFCSRGFDYRAEKSRAFSTVNGESALRLPKVGKTLVAFVANLLVEFDNRTMDMITFCGTYFPAENKQTSFDFFFEEVLAPFKFALVNVVVGGGVDVPDAVERVVEFAPSGLTQRAEYLVVGIYEAVASENFDEEAREELKVMTEGFAAALDSRDSLMIRAIWLGLRRALDSVGICKKETSQIDEVLRLYLMS